MNFALESTLQAPPEHDLESRSETAFLGMGGNLDGARQAIASALELLDAHPNIDVRVVSSLYQTAPIGLTSQPDFVNAVACIETRLAPEDLLSATLHIENLLGRIRTERWGPRVIDIDVLLYGRRKISTPRMTVPHARMHERAFVLVPLAELEPDLRLPGSTETVLEAADRLAKETRIVRVVESGLPSPLQSESLGTSTIAST